MPLDKDKMREYQRLRRAKLREPEEVPVEKPEAPRKRRINDPVAEPHREERTGDLPTMSEAIAGLSSAQQEEILRRISLIREGKQKDWQPDDLRNMR